MNASVADLKQQNAILQLIIDRNLEIIGLRQLCAGQENELVRLRSQTQPKTEEPRHGHEDRHSSVPIPD
ncbi:MAG TPA: hypothetical protein VNT26_14735 [Candidatus Sulfotelmatobacter sp.]|nr:hypothetical protein [Candidatus Sulfotelmatobacter sp.]